MKKGILLGFLMGLFFFCCMGLLVPQRLIESDPIVKALNGLIKSDGSNITAITDNHVNWNTAYGWGNHTNLYLDKNHDACEVTSTRITNWDTAYGWGNHANLYLGKNHDACEVTSTKINNWNTAYGWGNHATQHYFDTDINNLDNVPEGTNYKRVSATNHTDLTDSGDSTLHYHAADRARAGHTGTQPSNTISDFNTAADVRISNALINAMSDVDTTGATKNKVLMYSGTNWVDANTTDTFTFSIATFTNTGGTTTALIGGSTTAWKAAGAISFSATYNNPPPTSATVAISGAGDTWNGSLNMGGPAYQGPTVSTEDINYPSSNGGRITYTLSATDGETPDTCAVYSPYFYNHFVYDDLKKNSGFTDPNIDEMAATGTEIISSTTARTFTLTIATANYLCFAHRTGDTAVAQVQCGTGNNLITVAMNKNDATAVTPLKETVSHSNANAKTENFYVYASKLANLSALHSTSFTTTATATAQNYLYWGVTSTASGYTEADVEGLAYKISYNVTADYTLPNAVTLSNQYLLIAFPSRLGDNGSTFTFKDAGTMLPIGIYASSPEHVTVTNICGFQEVNGYHVWRSNQLLTTTNLSILVDF